MPSDLTQLQRGSNDALAALRAEASRLRGLAESGNLSDEDFERLTKVGDLLSKMEGQVADKLLGAMGLKLKFRNIPDSDLKELLGSMDDGISDVEK